MQCHRGTATARVHPVHFDECKTSAAWLPTFGPSQSTSASDPPKLAAIDYYEAQKLILILPSCGG